MAPDRVVLPASRNKSRRREVVDMFSWGGRPLDCHFANTRVEHVEMAKFVRSASKAMFY